jgi:hypothetical protein
MPFAFLIVGTVFVIAGVRNTVSGDKGLIALLKSDFTGNDNFLFWMLSILVIGAIGYSKDLQPLSRTFMALVVIVLLLSNGGVFNKLNQQLFGGSATSTNSLLNSSVSSLPITQSAITGFEGIGG